MSHELELLSLREVARRTGHHEQTVRRWRDRDGMPVYRIGERQAVIWSEFIVWVKSHPVQDHAKSREVADSVR